MKRKIALLFSRYINKEEQKWIKNPIQTQECTLKELVDRSKDTAFGRDFNFDKIKNYEDFKENVPIVSYEGLRKYIDRVVDGERDVLWKGKPLYLAKTSGTTSGIKYIPITKESMPTHIKSARNAILNYIYETEKTDFVDGKMIFLQGNPILEEKNGIKIGRLSGIVAHYVPRYLQKNRMPSWNTNCIDDWETKVNKIVEETLNEKMSVISGIPPWVQMYFEKLVDKTNKKIKDVFPHFSLFINGGVNYEPYRKKINDIIGKEIPTIELYPASEGFIAYQNSQKDNGLLLLLNNGIFYEFVTADSFFDEKPKRVSLKNVELGVNYVIILNTNAGLWGYNIGDTVEFTSLEPYKIRVTGRIKHYTSAFGEHVIGKEVDRALENALEKCGGQIIEFTVAPQVNPKEGLPYHEWFIEFEEEPENFYEFSQEIDKKMQEQNIYYKDLIKGKNLRSIVITKIKKGGFNQYMKSIGKLGGQNKLPRLSNDRKIADELEKYCIR